jgi:hypothetical protein
MFVLRQIFFLVVAAAILNPACCCARDLAHATMDAAPIPAGCCGGGLATDSSPDQPGCPNHCGCDHTWQAAEGQTGLTLVGPLPGGVSGPAIALDDGMMGQFLPAALEGTAPAQAPPAWRPVPAFLRSHAFRC